MTEDRRRLAYEMFYIAKGHIKYFNDDDLEAIIRDYTKRLWYNEEAYIYYDGFEEAYRAFLKGLTRFRRGEIVNEATRESTDVISENP